MIVYRHRRVVFGVNSSPFLLGATIEHHLNEILKTSNEHDLKEKLKRSFYVDNCVTSVNNEAERIYFQERATSIMHQAGFNLRGWEHTYDQDHKDLTSILGILWDKNDDTLLLNLNISGEWERPITKRKILAAAHKIFDPLGWTCPTALQPKLMLQQLWKEQTGWDTALRPEIEKEFTSWLGQISILQDLKVPRWIFGRKEDSISFHVFVDASKEAYAAAVFVRIEMPEEIRVHLVQAKSRVGPTESITIPRMELLGATLGARLFNSILKVLKFSQIEVTY